MLETAIIESDFDSFAVAIQRRDAATDRLVPRDSVLTRYIRGVDVIGIPPPEPR